MKRARGDAWLTGSILIYSFAVASSVAVAVPSPYLPTDDGFYYLQIGRNIAAGLGSTFDGLNLTNGYQPLWLVVVATAFRMAPSSEAAYQATIAIQAALMAFSAALLFFVVRTWANRLASLLAVTVWVHLSYRLSLSGLEYALHVTGLLVTVSYYIRHFSGRAPTRRKYLGLGLLLASVFLARLDAIILAGTLAAAESWLYVTGRRPGRPRTLALLGPSVMTAGLYAALNYWLFGFPIPISAVVKRAWSGLALTQDPIYQSAGWIVAKFVNVLWPWQEGLSSWAFAIIAGTWGCGLFWFARRRFDGLGPLGPFVLFSVVSFLGYAIVYHGIWSTSGWYYAMQPILAVVLGATAITWLQHWRSWSKRTVTGILFAGLIAVPTRTLWNISRFNPGLGRAVEPTLEALNELQPEAILGSWNAGILAYRSARPVVNLDGVANSWEYFHSRREHLCAYWREIGVTHIVDWFDFKSAPPAAPLYRQYRSLYDYSDCRVELQLVWQDRHQAIGARLAIVALAEANRTVSRAAVVPLREGRVGGAQRLGH